MSQSRREFLGSALKHSTLISLGLSAPAFLRRTALAAQDSIIFVHSLSFLSCVIVVVPLNAALHI